jgi:hypothetical protein
MNISIKNSPPVKLSIVQNDVVQIKYNKKDDFFPDNYYKYNLNGSLKTDFLQIKKNPKLFIYACCFRVIVSKPNKIIQNPFLEYLLFKYPNSNNKYSNLCIFPFRILGNDTIKAASKKLTKNLYPSNDCLGYIQNSKGIFLFYEIHYKNYKVPLLEKKNQLWWATLHEICNRKKILNFPIHNSVTKLFYNNSKLIYLKNKQNINIQVPTIGYYSETKELLPFISIMGIKSSSMRTFGPYYYFTDFINSFRGAWTSIYKERQIQDKTITDKNGLLNSSGFVRFVLFTNKPRVMLYRPTDPFYKFIKTLDTNKQRKLALIKIKWAHKWDSIIVSNFKFKNLSGFYQVNSMFVTKSFESFTSLSYHLIDKKSLKPVWDPNYNNYSII